MNKSKTISQLRSHLHKGKRERKKLCYCINIKPQCDTNNRQSTKRLQRQKESTPFYIVWQRQSFPQHVFKINDCPKEKKRQHLPKFTWELE